ncbi:hypothetical protein BHE74_00034624 [Ensete ventricosum]|nr:hypothetical protein GW17_00036594 [Ensete ventricosum]RWW58508.1 hypothetical protein BHE74_00034624 [Ensete ventricosum]RZS10881.1 hypothetical protein BHM03_00042160 [Ensete ventricosum]
MVIEEEESLKDYYNLLQQYRSLKNDVRDIVFSPKYCLPFLQPGRLVRIRIVGDDKMPSFSGEEQVTWGVIINFERVKGSAEVYFWKYITSEDVVELKGKVASEISSADELTLTELMFSGTLKDANLEEMVALLSCFVWQEKLQDAPKPREGLDLLYSQLQEIARRVANVQLECKVS